jgi:RHS repeat-associated protein
VVDSSLTGIVYDAQYASTDTGLIYLRGRVYDPTTGQFLSVDPLDAITQAPYNYANDDPVNESDPTGLGNWLGLGIPSPWEAAGKAVHVGLDIVAVPPYLLYYGSYYAARGINSVGCSSALGPIEPATCVASHLAAVPLAVPEAVGLAGDVTIDAIKGESICDEGVNGYINPFHSFLPPALRGPRTHLPGVHSDGSVDFEW